MGLELFVSIRQRIRSLAAVGAAVVVAGALATGCSPPPPPHPQNLVGPYLVTSYLDARTQTQTALFPIVAITLYLEADGGLLGKGCGSYSGAWSAQGNRFTIDNLTTDQQPCSEPPGVMEEREAEYLRALGGVTHWARYGDWLTLYRGGRPVVTAMTNPPRPGPTPP
jgi:heat shock protein HslJ